MLTSLSGSGLEESQTESIHEPQKTYDYDDTAQM